MSKTDVLPFTREAIQEYLDMAVRVWREKRDGAETDVKREMVVHYVDAFQSVRISIFGELLPPVEKE